MVQLSGVSKSYGPVTALQNVSLTVETGKTCVLIGPSGCGKSTLLRSVNGLVYPDSGTVEIDKIVLSARTVRSIRHSIGYAIQGGGLFPHLTARQNVILLAESIRSANIENRTMELCQISRFPPDRLDAYPGELSGGQKQRVALMRALMLDPPTLLLDEPLGALDPMIRADLQAELLHIIRSLGKTVLFVTHDLPEASRFADQIVLMKDGRVVQSGTFDQLRHEPATDFVRAFVSAQESLSFRS